MSSSPSPALKCLASMSWQSLTHVLKGGFKEEDFIPVSLGLNAANRSSIEIVGAILARLNVSVNNQSYSCAAMVYISPSCEGFYMSLEAMLDLNLFQIFNHRASVSGTCDMMTGGDSSDTAGDAGQSTESSPGSHPPMSSDEPCGCPERKPPPVRSDKLPFPVTPENNEKMETWLRDRFAASTFNTCPRQQLPEMVGPPVEIT